MIGWLLARPRLALYGVAGAAILGAATWAWLTVSGWRSDSQRLPVVEAERDAAVAARATAERAVLEQVETNARIERETNDALRRAGIAARDLADGLRRHYASLPRPQCPTAPAAGDPHGTAGEPADGDRVEAATGRHLEACARDAERLTGLQAYVRALPQRCVVAGE